MILNWKNFVTNIVIEIIQSDLCIVQFGNQIFVFLSSAFASGQVNFQIKTSSVYELVQRSGTFYETRSNGE